MTIRWLDEAPGTLGQFVFPFTVPPIGWPVGVPYPPPKPDWWPPGLMYPAIGDSWAPTPPPWWTAAGASLPNWPPPPPVGWPTNFPWPVPPSTVTPATMPCDSVCDAQFGPTGTFANDQALAACKQACSKTTFPVGPHNLVEPKPGETTPATTTPSTTTSTKEEKKSTSCSGSWAVSSYSVSATCY